MDKKSQIDNFAGRILGHALVDMPAEKRRNYATLKKTLVLPYVRRGGGLGSRPTKMYWERLGDVVEYHLMSPTPRR